MKSKGFVTIVVCLIAIATIFALMTQDGKLGGVVFQPALAAAGRAPPKITAVEPGSALNDVNTSITISGDNFAEMASKGVPG